MADVYSCISLEDFDSDPNKTVLENVCGVGSSCGSLTAATYCSDDTTGGNEKLAGLGLQDLPVDNCEVSEIWKEKFIEKYEDVFSRNHLDCGKATGFCHHIWLIDDRPFRLPNRRLSPAHYQKLRETLDEMEEREIIR